MVRLLQLSLLIVLLASVSSSPCSTTPAAFVYHRMPRGAALRVVQKDFSTHLTIPQLYQKSNLCMVASGGKKSSPSGRVAIVGAGISGLACAKELQAHGMDVLLFDTGRLHPGGRCSSKMLKVDGGKTQVLFDHSAQFLSAPSSYVSTSPSSPSDTWNKWVCEMECDGVLREWDSQRIGTLSRGGVFSPRATDSGGVQPRALIGSGGMRAIPAYMARNLEIDRPKWVSKARQNKDGTWRLWHYQEELDDFDYLVVAHNGKCAARLMKSAGPALAPVARLLETKFGANLRGGSTPRFMQLCSLYVLMVVLDGPVPLPTPNLEGAFVEGVPALSWVADQGAKLGQNVEKGPENEGTRRAWVIVSSPTFAEEHKVPQENIPIETAAEVTSLLLQAFRLALGKEGREYDAAFKVSTSALQLWGAGNPISVADVSEEVPFIFQASTGCGVCGDWMLAPSIPAAARSGIALAKHIADHHKAKKKLHEGGWVGQILTQDMNVGCKFRPAQGARPIGAFEGDKPPTAASVSRNLQRGGGHMRGGRREGRGGRGGKGGRGGRGEGNHIPGC